VAYNFKASGGSPPSTPAGRWDAPEQQRRWWLHNRPLPNRAAGGIDWPTVLKVTNQTSTAPSDVSFSDGNWALPDMASQDTTRMVHFQLHPGACNGYVWTPESTTNYSGNWDWAPGDAPSAAAMATFQHFLQSGATLTYAMRQCTFWLDHYIHTLEDQFGEDYDDMDLGGNPGVLAGLSAADRPRNHAQRVWNEWQPYTTSSSPTADPMGPNTLYYAEDYPGPTWPADVPNDVSARNFDADYFQAIRMEMFNKHEGFNHKYCPKNYASDYGHADGMGRTYILSDTWARDTDYAWLVEPVRPGYANEASSPHPVCTVAVAPVAQQVLGELQTAAPGCAATIPQGMPFISCKLTNGDLLRLDPTLVDDQTWEAKVPYSLHTWHSDSVTMKMLISFRFRTAATAGSSLVPQLACNRAAFSPRYGGRCAANVVQYLAFDERYWADPGTCPPYGGCLAGGITRAIGMDAKGTGASPPATYTNFLSWWTPPLWPWDLWYNVPQTGANPAAFAASQDKLNSLYVKQEPFRLPRNAGSAGEGRGRDAWVCVCVQAKGCDHWQHWQWHAPPRLPCPACVVCTRTQAASASAPRPTSLAAALTPAWQRQPTATSAPLPATSTRASA
jgi:hypothetical protein